MRFAVIGGGLAGLMAARGIKVAQPNSEVVLIERNHELGGLLSGVYYHDVDLYFDKGTHIFRETGNPEIDDFILNSILPEDLIHFEVGHGDIAGAFFEGRLQTNTHFPDIRHRHDCQELVKSLRQHVDNTGSVPSLDRLSPLLSGACDRFGEVYTTRVLAPLLSDLYQLPPEDLASFALLLPGFTRVVSMEYPEWLSISQNHNVRAIFAVPDQRQLPSHLRHSKRSFYSRRQGSRNFIDGIATSLEADGVKIVCGAAINSLDLNQLVLAGLDQRGQILKFQVDGIVIATGVIGAAYLLGINLEKLRFNKPLRNRIINLVVKEPVDSDLCYFYGIDAEKDFYRVTNYRGFSDNQQDKRLTIEVLGRDNIDDKVLTEHLLSQLKDSGFLSTNNQASFSHILNLSMGFPVPTTRNMISLDQLSKHIDQLLPNKAICGGIGSNRSLFFQNEIIEDIYQRAKDLSLSLT